MGARRVTRIRFHDGDPQIFGAILRNLVWATQRPGFVYSWSEVQISRSVCVRKQQHESQSCSIKTRKKDKILEQNPELIVLSQMRNPCLVVYVFAFMMPAFVSRNFK